MLKDATLTGCDLRGADLGGSDLRGADLSGSDLRSARLSLCDLSGSDLRGCDLTDADLSLSRLEGARLEGAVTLRTVFPSERTESRVAEGLGEWRPAGDRWGSGGGEGVGVDEEGEGESGWVGRVGRLVRCPQCERVMRDPVEVPCAHSDVICRECASESMGRGDERCRVCRGLSSWSGVKGSELRESEEMRRVLGEAEVHCPHRSRGCRFRGRKKDLPSHLRSECRVSLGEDRWGSRMSSLRLRANVSWSEVVEVVCVGGARVSDSGSFLVSRGTLRSAEGSFLSCVAEGSEGRVEVVCDGKVFGDLLRWLRL